MTQKEKVLKKLASKKWVTNIELNRICFRYGARIMDLRQEGYEIEGKIVKNNPRIWAWTLKKEPSLKEVIRQIND